MPLTNFRQDRRYSKMFTHSQELTLRREALSAESARAKQELMLFTATARWNFQGEAWLSVELEAANLDLAGALFYSMLPTGFCRGSNRLVAIRPQSADVSDPKLLAGRVSAPIG